MDRGNRVKLSVAGSTAVMTATALGMFRNSVKHYWLWSVRYPTGVAQSLESSPGIKCLRNNLPNEMVIRAALTRKVAVDKTVRSVKWFAMLPLLIVCGNWLLK